MTDPIDIMCQAIADQRWMEMDDHMGDIFRILATGPGPNDDLLINKALSLLAWEVAQRREAREEANGD